MMKTEAKERGVATATMDPYVWRRTVGRDYVAVIVMEDCVAPNLAAHLVSVKAEELKWVFMRSVCDLERFGHWFGCVMRSDQDTAFCGSLRPRSLGHRAQKRRSDNFECLAARDMQDVDS